MAQPDTHAVGCALTWNSGGHKFAPLLYFPSQIEKWAVDGKCKCQVGDIVLVKDLPKKLTPEVKSEIQEIVFKQGAIVDPITGRRCRGTEFIDEKERKEEVLRRDIEELKIKRTKMVDVSQSDTVNK